MTEEEEGRAIGAVLMGNDDDGGGGDGGDGGEGLVREGGETSLTGADGRRIGPSALELRTDSNKDDRESADIVGLKASDDAMAMATAVAVATAK